MIFFRAQLVKSVCTFLIFIPSIVNNVLGQEHPNKYLLDLSINGNLSHSDQLPFWFRSNQFGSIPISGVSSSLLINTKKLYTDYENSFDNGFKSAKFDWAYDLELRGNVGKTTNFNIIEAAIKGKYGIFEAKLGRSKDVMGLNGDTVLSSGNFSVSGNALGIPKLDIQIPQYYRIPIFDGIISVKGNFALGSFGSTLIDTSVVNKFVPDGGINTFYHQKSLYGRIGRKSWKLNLYGGINHQVQFGNEKQVYGDSYALNNFQNLWYVFWGKPYQSVDQTSSKVGNHQGSIDLGMSYDWDHIQLLAYRQNIYDVGAMSKLANIADGLNGITITNKSFNRLEKTLNWQKLLVEFFYSKNQAGYPWSTPTKSGDEDYYNNFFYSEGWSYKNLGLGTPLIVAANLARPGQANDPKDFFISNRVIAGHVGFRGAIYGTLIQSKITASRHFGTFGTSEYGKSTGTIKHEPYKDQFVPVNQFSAYLQAERPFKNNLVLGMAFAYDYGKLLPSSSGVQVSIKKSILK